MEEPEHSHGTTPSSSSSSSTVTTSTDGPSSSLPSTSQVQEEVENEQHENGENDHFHHHHHHHHHQHHILLNHRRQQQQPSNLSYRVNISISDAPSTETRDDVWACLFVLVTFWFFGKFHPHLRFPLLHLLPSPPTPPFMHVCFTFVTCPRKMHITIIKCR